MTRFADMLMGLAPGYIHAPVLDATGLDGSWAIHRVRFAVRCLFPLKTFPHGIAPR
jgi:hypothetical protein